MSSTNASCRGKSLTGIMLYGKNWKEVEQHVGSRSGTQIRSHAQKFFIRLEKEYTAKLKAEGKVPSKKEIKEKLLNFTEPMSQEKHEVEEEFPEESSCPLKKLIRK
jgi:hypothetical protein